MLASAKCQNMFLDRVRAADFIPHHLQGQLQPPVGLKVF